MAWENVGGARLSNEFRRRALAYVNSLNPDIIKPYGPDFGRVTNRILLTLLRSQHPLRNLAPGNRRGDYRFFINKLPPVVKNSFDRIFSGTPCGGKNQQSPQDFYLSKEWRMVRYQALVKYGAQCQCCGRRPPEVMIHVDHVKPRSKYPELELVLSNLQVLCEDCNLGKSNKDNTDWRESSVACAETGSATVVNDSMNGMQSQS